MSEFDISSAIGTLENHSSKNYPRSERLSFFDIAFDSPNWEDAVILDLGGNRGNLREDLEQKNIGKRANYHCLDVDHEALAFGQSNLPESEWVPFNAYNPVYNKTGLLSQKFPFGDNMFDLLCCYSVYSHTTHENFMHDIKEMQRVVKPGGKIAVTFVDEDSVKFFLTKRRQDYPDKFIIKFGFAQKWLFIPALVLFCMAGFVPPPIHQAAVSSEEYSGDSPNIVLLSWDTVRADVLSLYGGTGLDIDADQQAGAGPSRAGHRQAHRAQRGARQLLSLRRCVAPPPPRGEPLPGN